VFVDADIKMKKAINRMEIALETLEIKIQ